MRRPRRPFDVHLVSALALRGPVISIRIATMEAPIRFSKTQFQVPRRAAWRRPVGRLREAGCSPKPSTRQVRLQSFFPARFSRFGSCFFEEQQLLGTRFLAHPPRGASFFLFFVERDAIGVANQVPSKEVERTSDREIDP